jgi:cytochrome c oxidase assembly factor CtaG
MLASSLGLLGGLYLAGVVRIWRSAGVGRGVRTWEAGAFASGWVALIIALFPPIDRWSTMFQAAHMVQHELLMVVAAPLIAISAPIVALLWGLPLRLRRNGLELLRRPPVTLMWAALTAPISVFLLHAVALWVWHLPALYDAALAHESIHVVQHLCFFGSAALFWWGIANGRYRRAGYGVAVVYVFATAVHSGVLGALMTLSPRVWYPPYLIGHPSGLTPLEDQQIAGLLMWVPAGVILVAAGLALFAAWLRESDRGARYKPTARENSTS